MVAGYYLSLVDIILEVYIGWSLRTAAGVGVRCNGNESTVINCSFYDVHSPCHGGPTTISCFTSGKIELD